MGFKPHVGQVGLETPGPVTTLAAFLPLPKGQQGHQHPPVLASWPGAEGLLPWRWSCARKVPSETMEGFHGGLQRT